ncbi:MAG: hypothetical protein QXF01_00440 [Candidatus Micrarchaeaceae archaeon]
MALRLTPFLILPGALTMFALRVKGAKKNIDAEILAFSGELLRNYTGGLKRALLAAGKRKYSFRQQINEINARIRLGCETALKHENQHLNELFAVLYLGLGRGVGVRSALSQFASRLERQLRQRNRTMANSGAMRYVTHLGMSFFLPLFGGISSTILTATGSLIGNSPGIGAHGLLYSMLAYIFSVLAVDAFFSNGHITYSELISSVIPVFSISAFVLLASAAYASYAI